MAKDKSKKKDSNDSGGFANPSDATAPGEGWKLTEGGKDRLLLFTPLREEEVKAFGKAGENGEKSTIIVADVVVIDEKNPEASEEHEGVWIFQRYIQGSLREFIGDRKVLGRLRNTEDTTKAKSNAGGYYWELEDASKKDVEKALAYQAAANDPFRSKKEKKSKAEPEPEAKKGKGKKKK